MVFLLYVSSESLMYFHPSMYHSNEKAGNSVMCHVTGFLPYFYIPAPIGFQRTQLQAFQVALEVSRVLRGVCVDVVESSKSRTTSNSSR